MAKGGLHVEGLRQTVKALEQAGVAVDDLKEAFGRIAAEAAEIIASEAPSKTGKLRASIRGNRAKGKAVVMAGRARVQYAGPINYGWPKRGIKPQMFMQAADKRIGDKAIQMLEDNLNEVLTKEGLS